MRILLTGATGFIGSRLKEELEKNHDVRSLVRYVSGGRYDFYSNDKTVFANLGIPGSVERAVFDTHPEVIIHLGAQSAVSWSFLNPDEVMDVNLKGTVALADAARRLGIKAFIHASTSEVYGKAVNFPTKEDEVLVPTSPYAVSKIAAEQYLGLMRDSYDFPVVIMRPFNTFGRGLIGNPHFVVERAITGALSQGKISLHNPFPQRDFLFREDHVAGYLRVLENLDKAIGGVFNLTSGGCWSIKEMAEQVAAEVGYRLGIKVEVEFKNRSDRPRDIDRLQGDSTRANTILGWTTEYSLEEGIRKAVEEWSVRLLLQGSRM